MSFLLDGLREMGLSMLVVIYIGACAIGMYITFKGVLDKISFLKHERPSYFLVAIVAALIGWLFFPLILIYDLVIGRKKK